jgi:predicted ATPase
LRVLSKMKGGLAARTLFDATVHLNRSSELLSNQKQRAELAKLNLVASKYCEEKSAFSRAVKILQTGLAVLGSDSTDLWSEENFDLTFEMRESLARIQLIVGDFEGCKETTREGLKHGRTVEMKINLLVIDVEVRLAKLDFEDSMRAANSALKTLGVDIPLKVKPRHAVAKLFKIRRMLKGKSDEDIINLPVRQDALATSVVKILMHVYFFCLAKQAKSQAIHAALLAIELTLRNGLTPHSSSAFVSYGAVEVALGKSARACRYGHLALRVLDRVGYKDAKCTTVGFATILLKFREETFAQLAGPLAEAGTSGLDRGDVIYGTFCCSQSCQMHQLMGTNLATLEAYMRAKYDLVCDLSQEGMIMWLQYGLQSVINMRSNVSDWSNIAVLTGEIMNERDFLNDVTVANHPVVTVGCLIAKAQTACYFDQYSYAADIYREVETMDLDAMRFSFAAPYYWWNAARTFYSLHEMSGKRRDLWRARKYRRLLQRIAKSGCPNATPLEAFLVTQDLARAKHIDDEKLYTVYEQGIQQMADADLVHLEGLLNEKAGFHYAKRERRAEAERYFDRVL